MELFSYGVGIIEKEKFEIPNGVERFNNKINGGLWLCPKNDLYSDWVVVTLHFPNMVRTQEVIGNTLILKNDCKIAHINKDNYKEFMKDNLLDLLVCKTYDALHFNKNLIEIKEFETYYIECYQLMNYDCIENIDSKFLSIEKIISKEYRTKAKILMKNIIKHIENTDAYKAAEEIF